MSSVPKSTRDDYLKDLIANPEGIAEMIRAFESSSLGRAFKMLVEDAEKGRIASVSNPLLLQPDKLIRPKQVAEILGYSWKHCKNKLLPRFDVVSKTGDREHARYLQSDILGIQAAMIEEGDAKAIATKERAGSLSKAGG